MTAKWYCATQTLNKVEGLLLQFSKFQKGFDSQKFTIDGVN